MRPKHPGRFWELVKLRALEIRNWDLLEKMAMPEGGIIKTIDAGGRNTGESRVVVPASEEGMQVDQGGSVAPQGGVQAFPVFKAVPNMGQVDRHDVVAWKVVQDLQDKVEKYGLGSLEVMQVIRVLNTDLLVPFDIKHLGQVLFQHVQFRVFEDNWTQVSDKTAADNM